MVVFSWSKSESNQWEKYLLCLRRESIHCCDSLAFLPWFPPDALQVFSTFQFRSPPLCPPMSPGPWIFSFLKGCSSSVLGRRSRKPARKKQQEAGQQRPQQNDVGLGTIPEKLLLLECAWLGLPWGLRACLSSLVPLWGLSGWHPGTLTSPCIPPGTWARRLLELAPARHGPCTHLGQLQHPTRAACSLWVSQNWAEMSYHLNPVALQSHLLLSCSISWLQGKWETKLQPSDASVSICGWSPGGTAYPVAQTAYPTTCLQRPLCLLHHQHRGQPRSDEKTESQKLWWWWAERAKAQK